MDPMDSHIENQRSNSIGGKFIPLEIEVSTSKPRVFLTNSLPSTYSILKYKVSLVQQGNFYVMLYENAHAKSVKQNFASTLNSVFTLMLYIQGQSMTLQIFLQLRIVNDLHILHYVATD